MSEICTKCGLPKELCVCETIAKESQRIVVRKIQKKFGKTYTVIEGIDPKEIGLKELTKKMKNQLACGGTVKNGVIELQGEHRQNAKKSLIQVGFAAETIEVRN